MKQSRKPLLIYIVIGLLVLLAGGLIGAWVRSKSNAVSTDKSEISSNASQATEQKKSLQEEQPGVERETPKLADERKDLETKTSEPISQPTKRAPRPSGGTWFVVLGSFTKNDNEKANQRLQYIQGLGYDVRMIETNNYPGLKGDLLAVVVGPYSKSKARNVAAQMKSVLSDAYIKSGW
jgi:cell division septation protein DedD